MSPSSFPTSPMSPGTYLRKRREAANLSLEIAAFRLATLPEAALPAQVGAIDRLAFRLADAEEDRAPLDLAQAGLLRRVYAFDLDAYEKLLLLHLAGPESGLPQPQLCRTCGCSWNDACLTGTGPCAWSDDPTLCTACVPATAPVQAGPAPRPAPTALTEGAPA